MPFLRFPSNSGLWYDKGCEDKEADYASRSPTETTFENMKREPHPGHSYLEASEEGHRFLEEVMRLLRQRAVMSKKLTVGKLREAIALDHTDHQEEWLLALQEVT